MIVVKKFLPVFIICVFYFIRSDAQSDTANSLYADSSFYKTWKLAINSTTDDFSPTIYKNGIVFTSDRENEFGVVYIDKGTKKHLLDVFFAEQQDSFNFAAPTDFSRKINSAYHDGPVCFSSDEKTIYFTTNGRKEQKKVLMIYESHYLNGEWSEAEPLKLNDPEYSIAHPALTHDGQTLYFASDMPGGFGGTDLYMSTKDMNNEWSKPINLGPEINTKTSEKFPFVDANGVLYFSTDGHGGLGKLDIFSAVKNPNGHYDLKNLGYPINSKADDFGFTCDSLYSKGFYSSGREGVHDNIYGFYAALPKFCNCDTASSSSALCYTFFEERSVVDNDTAGTSYEWDFGDGTKAKGNSVDHCFSKPGKYSIKLNVIDNSTGVLFYNQSSYDIDLAKSSGLSMNVPDSIGITNNIAIDGKGANIPGYTIRNYFWKIDEHDFRRGVKTEINYSAPGEKKIRFGVFAVNNTTKQMKEFCTLKSIYVVNDKNFSRTKRLRDSLAFVNVTGTYIVHFGSTKNMNNSNSHVFSTYKEVNNFYAKGIYRFSSGEIKEITETLPYGNKMNDKGSIPTIAVFENDKVIPDPFDMLKGSIKDPEKVDAYTIFFNQGEFTLNGSKKINLDDIKDALLKNPQFKLDIVAHTDGRGPLEYNQKLAKDRANSIKSYLVSQGCDSKRIRTLSVIENAKVSAGLDDLAKRAYRRADLILHE